MKWHSLLLTVILMACLLAAGCTDEGSTAPGPAPPGAALRPGQVLQAFGDVTGEGQLGSNLVSGTIDTITFTMGLAPGAKSINMENISIVYADAIRTETLVPVDGYRGDPPQGSWGLLSVINEIGRPNNRLEDQEQFVIRINPKAPLVPRQLMTISIKGPTGTPLTIRRVSPSTITKDDNILSPV